MRKEISIAIDMDDVLADTTGKIVHIYNDIYKTDYTMADLMKMDLRETMTSDIIDVLLEEFNKPGFARDLALKEHAIDVVEALNEKYDIYIATAAMEVPGTFTDKYEWLEEHFPFLDPNYFIFCGNKKVVQADYLIDDNIDQLHNFTGPGILKTAYLNQGMSAPFTRKDNWLELKEHFIEQYDDRLAESKEHRKSRYKAL